MGTPYVTNATTFLVETLCGLYLLILMLRFLLQLFRADFYNPVSQFIVTATHPPLKPLRRFVPGYKGIDTACLVLMFVLQLATLWLLRQLGGNVQGSLLVLAFAELINLTLQVFFFAILFQVILSWVGQNRSSPITTVLYRLTEPLLGPARRVIPSMGGMDISPIPVMIGIQLMGFLVVDPLRDVARLVG